MNRRSFLRLSTPLLLYQPIQNFLFNNGEVDIIITVNGPVPIHSMGLTLTHEHLFSTFGLAPEEKGEYDSEKLIATVLPFLKQAKAAGCKTIFDCTAAYFGRNVYLLKRLSEESGMHIVTNTGFYGAANGRYIPAYAHVESVEEISNRWLNEFKNGIDKSGIKPGFIKLGFNNGPLTRTDKKLLEAAAKTHLRTGLTIAAHTSNNPEGAFAQLEILSANNVSPAAWIWTHAHDVPTDDQLLEAAKKGAWISFDGYRPQNHERFLKGVKAMKSAGYLHQLLLSHDGDGYPQKGKMPSSLSIQLLTHFLPALLRSGFTNEDVHLLTVKNPGKAFALRVRRLR